MTKQELAQKLEELAELNKTAPEDYYGGQYWGDEDIALLRESAAALRGSDEPKAGFNPHPGAQAEFMKSPLPKPMLYGGAPGGRMVDSILGPVEPTEAIRPYLSGTGAESAKITQVWPEVLDDGFGNRWVKCGPDCKLEIVRPGKVQCACDKNPELRRQVE